MPEPRIVQDEPEVLEGEDDVPRQPSGRRDPFVPEPGPRAGLRTPFAALRWAWIPIAVAVGFLIWALVD